MADTTAAPPAPETAPPPQTTVSTTQQGGGLGGGFWGNLIGGLTGSTPKAPTDIRTDLPLSDAQRNTNKMLLILAVVLIILGSGTVIYFGFIKK